MKEQKTEDAQGRVMTRLLPWFMAKMPGAKNISIENIQKPGMGLSNETYLFDLNWDEAGDRRFRPLVLRTAPQDHRVFPDYRLSHQFMIMKALKGTPVPVPEMIWNEEDESILGTPFYVMERLNGTMPKDYPSYHSTGMLFDASLDDRSRIWRDSVRMLACVHDLDWKALGLDFLGVPSAGTGPLDRQIAYWERYLDWLKDSPDEEHPVIQAGLAWLKEHAYEPERVSLCWGDARVGNILYREGDYRILALLDWEMAFIGDPEADLAWFIFIDRYLAEEYRIPRLEGLPGKEETIRHYEECAGRPVRHFEYQEVFAAVRFGMILVSVVKKLMRIGMHDYAHMLKNNYCVRYLSSFLGLPLPEVGNDRPPSSGDGRVTIQFCFSGLGGRERYIVEENGVVSIHDGRVEHPTCTVRATAQDWQDLQDGRLNQLDAWTTGRLVIDGDLNTMVRLKDHIKRLAP